MAAGCGSMIRPVKNASFNIVKSNKDGDCDAILAFGELLEAGGLSNLTSNFVFKISGNAKESLIEDVTLYPSSLPAPNPSYEGILPASIVLLGHKPTGRRGQTSFPSY